MKTMKLCLFFMCFTDLQHEVMTLKHKLNRPVPVFKNFSGTEKTTRGLMDLTLSTTSFMQPAEVWLTECEYTRSDSLHTTS